MSISSLENAEFRRGPGGRPTRAEAERRHRSLLATAFRLFLEKGWDGASIDEISRQSGVAKRFIYARYADKAALLVGAIERLFEDNVGALNIVEPLPQDVEEGLHAFGRRLLDLALRPETLAFQRRFIAEAARYPDLAKLFIARNRLLDMIIEVLATYAERGAIDLGDPRLRAEQFFILVVGVPQRFAMLIGRESPAEEERRLRAAIRLFLDGCRRRA
ncbi:MAG TPA: TetR/AcrR family transcriptional regulator [Xanthobacteraceae bacterium]|nr:TetR/AcrR family transcriptional regulator [Xanthobacteraceae bacterium]